MTQNSSTRWFCGVSFWFFLERFSRDSECLYWGLLSVLTNVYFTSYTIFDRLHFSPLFSSYLTLPDLTFVLSRSLRSFPQRPTQTTLIWLDQVENTLIQNLIKNQRCLGVQLPVYWTRTGLLGSHVVPVLESPTRLLAPDLILHLCCTALGPRLV